MFGYYCYDSCENHLEIISSNQSKNINLFDNVFYKEEHTIEYIKDYIIKALLDRGLSNIVIQLTKSCNLRCTYCSFTQNDGTGRLHENERVEMSTVRSVLDYVHSHSIDSNSMIVGFYGGEPFLNYQTMIEAIKYAESLFEGKDLLFSVTTNATLLSDDVLMFMEKHNISLTISLDGSKQIHDKNRVYTDGGGSFEQVKNVINNILHNYSDLTRRTAINMVIDPEISISEYQKIYEEIPGIVKMKIISSFVSDIGLKEKHFFSAKTLSEYEYEMFVERLHIVNEKAIRFSHNKRILETMIRQKLNHIKQHSISKASYPSGPCIPGYLKLFSDVHGNFYPCEKVSEIVPEYIIGNCKLGISLEKVQHLLQISKITKKECEHCWCFNLCQSCSRYCTDGKTISREVRLKNCDMFKKQAVDDLCWRASMMKYNEMEIDY